MADIADKLDEARALIEKGWTRGWFARNAEGRKVSASPRGRAAACFCSVGAIMRVTGADQLSVEDTGEFEAMARAIGQHWIDDWNDAPERTQAEVVDAFKRAAALARAEQ